MPKKWIVFLAWAPHHVNDMIDMTSLTGSTEKTFDENNGVVTVYTNVRPALPEEQPNVVQFLKNVSFSIRMMNAIMSVMHNDKSSRTLRQPCPG
ncbi:MAG: hypothetical protein CSA33_03515 [Desulfobulbus propionicus]|nr:MAG: hypothetical protein CSA33_03515 [Desulfobulbus propionicus]